MVTRTTKGQFKPTQIINGDKYNRWTAINFSHKHPKTGNVFWNFICECGVSKPVSVHRVVSGDSKSCGCIRHEAPFNKTHGLRNHSLYRVWRSMKGRCNNPKLENYPNYGGRGIKVCVLWHSFINFYNDMKEGYIEGEVILDRINNDGDYELSNCKWSTSIESANNKRTNKYISYKGIVRTIAEWGRYLGIKDNTIGSRMRKGWSNYECLFGKSN